MQVDTELLELQRRFMTALREPIYGDSRERSGLPDRTGNLSEVFAATAEALIAPSATLEPVERLELYHRQYWYRLLDSIAEDFPALRLLLGDEGFWRLCEAYLEAVPSTSFTLRHLGRGLADFIAARPELVTHPVHAEDLARLEYALCTVFEAGERPQVSGEKAARVGLSLQPYLQLLALRTPADTLWRRADDERALGRIGPPAAEPRRFVAVFREGLALRVERLPRAAFAILTAIAETGSLERAMDRTLGKGLLRRRRDAERITGWFTTWVSRGWLVTRAQDSPMLCSFRTNNRKLRPVEAEGSAS
jgi:hypothetical protein